MTRRGRQPHRLDHLWREVRALVEVDGGFGRRARDVGIRGQVDDDVVALHGLRQSVQDP